MSFERHNPNAYKKTEVYTSVHAIGLSHSLLSCSPAELNSASLNNQNYNQKIRYFYNQKNVALDT